MDTTLGPFDDADVAAEASSVTARKMRGYKAIVSVLNA
jgi:hypothetical protein